jgi:hypothetical protein
VASAASARTHARILVVADWTVDPHAVVAACSRRAAEEAVWFTLMVPASLHGLDWAGDPTASVPCAQRQLETITELSIAAGLDVEVAGVGDPDSVSAIGDALNDHLAAEILLFGRERRFARLTPGRSRPPSAPCHRTAGATDRCARGGWCADAVRLDAASWGRSLRPRRAPGRLR